MSDTTSQAAPQPGDAKTPTDEEAPESAADAVNAAMARAPGPIGWAVMVLAIGLSLGHIWMNIMAPS